MQDQRQPAEAPGADPGGFRGPEIEARPAEVVGVAKSAHSVHVGRLEVAQTKEVKAGHGR